MIEILTGSRRDGRLDAKLLDSMFALRSRVFHDRLGWKVRCVRGREIDGFDDLDPTYMIARDLQRRSCALGCWRLLPTTGPYMLRDVFPELLDGAAAPCDPHIWEISRFAVATDTETVRPGGFGFSRIPVAMLRQLLGYARDFGIDAYIGVTTVAIERLVRNLGLPIRRCGPARRIGDVSSIAFRLPMDARSERVLWGSRGRPDLRRAA
jgi:acyl homoserine lactone synthase